MQLRFWDTDGNWQRTAWRWLIAVAMAAACPGLVAQSPDQHPNDLTGMAISEIRFRGVEGKTNDPLTEYVALKPRDRKSVV